MMGVHMVDDEGFTYMEVLIAMAVLSIFMIPMAAGFFQSGLQFKHAYQYYEASLLAENLLTEASNALMKGRVLRVDGNFQEFLGSPGFMEDYDLEEYDYVLQLNQMTHDPDWHADSEINSGDKLSLSTNPAIVKTANVTFSSSYQSLFSVDENSEAGIIRESIVYDGAFQIQGGRYATVINNECIITIPRTQPDDVKIQLVISNPDELMAEGDVVVVRNQSASDVFLSVYRDPKIKDELIHIEYESSGAGDVVTQYFQPKAAQKHYMAVVDVYDKQQKLLKRVAKPVFFSV